MPFPLVDAIPSNPTLASDLNQVLDLLNDLIAAYSVGVSARFGLNITVPILYQTAGTPEHGYLGAQFYTTLSGVQPGIVVNFKRTMVNTPTGLTLTSVVSTNVASPFLSNFDVTGCFVGWTATNPGYTTYIARYATVGNSLRAVRADGTCDVHCDACDALAERRVLKTDLIINDSLYQRVAQEGPAHPGSLGLCHICPECGSTEHFNAGLASKDEALNIPGWEQRAPQAVLIRQAMQQLGLPTLD